MVVNMTRFTELAEARRAVEAVEAALDAGGVPVSPALALVLRRNALDVRAALVARGVWLGER